VNGEIMVNGEQEIAQGGLKVNLPVTIYYFRFPIFCVNR